MRPAYRAPTGLSQSGSGRVCEETACSIARCGLWRTRMLRKSDWDSLEPLQSAGYAKAPRSRAEGIKERDRGLCKTTVPLPHTEEDRGPACGAPPHLGPHA